MRSQKKSLPELLAGLTLMPQILINTRVPKGYRWQEDALFVKSVEKAQKEIADRGRVLIRPSGAGPLLRVMAEADEAEFASTMAQMMSEAIAR